MLASWSGTTFAGAASFFGVVWTSLRSERFFLSATIRSARKMMRTFRNLAASAILGLTVAACSTATETRPARTATEQLLISTAAERAAEQLNVPIPKGAKVFVDATNFEGYDAKYAIGAIRESLVTQGARLVDAKADAETIVEIRAGALSTNEKSTLVGIPSFNIPVPFAGNAPFPKIALYERRVQEGVAKFAAMSYDAKEGGVLDASSDPAFGFSHTVENVALFFISWTTDDTMPPDEENAHSQSGE